MAVAIPTRDAVAADEQRGAPRGAVRVLGRIAAILAEDWRNLHPRLLLVNALLKPLPRTAAVPLRGLLYRRVLGIRAGRGTRFEGNIVMQALGSPYGRLQIGRDCRIGAVCFVLNDRVELGDRVVLESGASLTTDTHRIGPAAHRMGAIFSKPIRVEDGARLCAGCIVHPGVTVGAESVVAADSVVTDSVPARALVSGVVAGVRALSVVEVERLARGETAPPEAVAWQALPVPRRRPGRAFSLLRVRLLLAEALLLPVPAETGTRLRCLVYRRLAGIKVGKGTVFLESIRLRGSGDPRQLLTIGENCGIRDVSFVLEEPISIGSGTWISTGAVVSSAAREMEGGSRSGPVSVGEGCWLTQRTNVAAGVSIGDGTIVTNKSVVLDDLPAGVLAGGAPARVLREIPDRKLRRHERHVAVSRQL